MSSNKKYWKNPEELNADSSVVEALQTKEFTEDLPSKSQIREEESQDESSTSRRDFLKYVGFSTAAATLAACEGPVIKSIPYVFQPERIVPGVANYYATTMADGFDFSSVLVKTREGRPIKIEWNDKSKAKAAGGARVHASVLSLYDTKRLQNPSIDGADVTWKTFDDAVKKELDTVGGKPIVFLTQTFASPSTQKLIEDFKAKYPTAKHITYDAVSEHSMLEAFKAKYGVRALPNYDFSKAETIVSVGADILGDWQGGGFDADYSKSRVPQNGKMSKHIQFEANLTTTGANADERVPAKPSVQKNILLEIYRQISGEVSVSPKLDDKHKKATTKAVKHLKKAGNKAIFVTGIQDKAAQAMALAINEALGSQVIDTQNYRLIRQGNDDDVKTLVKDMNAGKVGALISCGVDPAYALPEADQFISGLKKVKCSVSFATTKHKTAMLSKYVAATPHYLESWGDVQMTKNHFALTQPTIQKIFNTRQFQECLLKWTDSDEKYYDYLKNSFSEYANGVKWNTALHDGVFEAKNEVSTEKSENNSTTTESLSQMISAFNSNSPKGDFELTLYTKVAMGDGKGANNPWLQEFPDPITRNTWDNYLTISKTDADKLGIENRVTSKGAIDGDLVNITLGQTTLNNVPVMVQPGQALGSVGLALGYGQVEGLQDEMKVGVNAYPLYKNFKNIQAVSIEKASGNHEFASLQLQNTMAGRKDIIVETSLADYVNKDKEEWNPTPVFSKDHKEYPFDSNKVNLWQEFDRSIGHHFNLSIDLNACTGCGACVIACHSENNVPVVGKAEVRNNRNMHWLRIDRYYSAGDTFDEEQKRYKEDGALDHHRRVEDESFDNPQVAFQPVMCQHCNHAPCETVCPVGAIGHGRQGQNQMTYNRCIGTRYCGNNCPYKVRRFNWFRYNKNDEFDYHMNNDLGRMVLNPDVTVRSRGVMEKCSMCIQMTQKSILDAKRDGRPVKDEEFQTACSNACDSGALVFGDVNDKSSTVYEKLQDDRKFYLLGYLGVKPNVFYQTKITNRKEV
ncbi:TAT-variant-translocated molybdopterin oxidoreductase [Psychroflexus sp. MBR-150]|jgi:molybdopterin-containing oxidoreductase family iron-sulfur binding subunit